MDGERSRPTAQIKKRFSGAEGQTFCKKLRMTHGRIVHRAGKGTNHFASLCFKKIRLVHGFSRENRCLHLEPIALASALKSDIVADIERTSLDENVHSVFCILIACPFRLEHPE